MKRPSAYELRGLWIGLSAADPTKPVLAAERWLATEMERLSIRGICECRHSKHGRYEVETNTYAPECTVEGCDCGGFVQRRYFRARRNGCIPTTRIPLHLDPVVAD